MQIAEKFALLCGSTGEITATRSAQGWGGGDRGARLADPELLGALDAAPTDADAERLVAMFEG